MDPRYDKGGTCSWRNRPIGQVRLWKNRCHCRKSGLITPTSESCCDSDDPRENACEDTYTLKIEDEDPDSEGLERLESRNLLKCEKVLMLVLFEGNIVSTSGHMTTQKCQHQLLIK